MDGLERDRCQNLRFRMANWGLFFIPFAVLFCLAVKFGLHYWSLLPEEAHTISSMMIAIVVVTGTALGAFFAWTIIAVSIMEAIKGWLLCEGE